MPLPSGALYWPRQKTLLVADLHLEKLSSYARGGQMLPPYDTGVTLRLLARDLATTGAERVISLGDSFHRDEGSRTLLPQDLATLRDLTARAEWTWIAGNHDPAPHGLGRCIDEVELDGITLTHLPQPGSKPLISGHLHPGARVRINGRSCRAPCFVHDGQLMILPAYGVATGCLNILSSAFIGLFRREHMEVTMLGRDEVYPVSIRRLERD